MCNVRDHVRHDRRAAGGQDERDCELGEPFHLSAPLAAVDVPQDGSDSVDRSVAPSRCPGATQAIIEMTADLGTSGKSRHAGRARAVGQCRLRRDNLTQLAPRSRVTM